MQTHINSDHIPSTGFFHMAHTRNQSM